MPKQTLAFETYLEELELDTLGLDAAQRARIERELRDHLEDAAAETGADPADPAYQDIFVRRIGRSEDMARQFHAVYGKSYHWCALVSTLGLGLLTIISMRVLPMIVSDFIQIMIGLAIMVGVFGLYGRYGARVGAAGRAGLMLSMVSMALISALTGLHQLLTSSMTYLDWGAASIVNGCYALFYVGLLLFGIMVWRKKAFPRWNILPALFGASGAFSIIAKQLLNVTFIEPTPLTSVVGMMVGIGAVVGWLGTFLVLWSDRRAEPAL